MRSMVSVDSWLSIKVTTRHSPTEGPIVRITPNELHIKDTDYFEEVFPASNKPTEKSPVFSGAFGKYAISASPSGFTSNNTDSPLSILTTIPHDLHKMRRAPLNPFFSKRSVTAYASLIQASIDKLCARLEEFHTRQSPLNLRLAFSALTADVISWYSYGRSYDMLEKPDFNPELYGNLKANGELALFLRYYPWVMKIANFLPYWLVKFLNPKVMTLIKSRKVMQFPCLLVPYVMARFCPTTINNFTSSIGQNPFLSTTEC